MANIFDLLSNGQIIEKKEIVEGLNPPLEFNQRIKSFFPETVYNLNSDSLLYKFLYSILGDSGVNSIKKSFLAPKLYQALSTTNFNDLDSLFANVVQLTRVSDEIYKYDPYNQMLTQDQWAEIKRKDAWYKTRSQDFMRGIHLGNTRDGLKLLGRAATGYECDIFERWKYLDDINSDQPIGIPNYGKTNSPQEFVIRPQSAGLTPQEQRRINEVVKKIKPSNSLFTIESGSSLLDEVGIRSIRGTSTNFFVQRYVTGNTVIDYSNNQRNNWIKAGETKEAPTQAYSDKMESVIYLTPFNVTSSSFHLGNFSTEQQRLFPHLKRGTNTYPYSADQAISDNPDTYKMNSPWTVRNIGKDSFIINDHYPVGYLADNNFLLDKPTKLFWASEEAEPDLQETLDIDLGRTRPVNMVQFEICQKPVDVFVLYYDETTEDWESVVFRDDINSASTIDYNGVGDYSWQSLSFYFETVQTNKIRILMARRSEPFPYPNSPIFPWSIELRNVKLAQIISSIEDFVPSSGVDIIGNAYTTDIVTYGPEKAIDESDDTYWQSQINPTKFAVEALYLDVRDDKNNASFVDEVYLDPLTPECLMHIYYSVDDTNEDNWDNKLWVPIPRHYLLKRGNFKLTETIQAKYLKLEFTKLNTVPYNSLNLPIKLDVTYRMFPSWVEGYIYENLSGRPNNPLNESAIYKRITSGPTTIGLINPSMDKLKDEFPRSLIDFISKNRKSSVLAEYQVWKNPDTNQLGAPILNKEIQIYPNFTANLYQQNLLFTVKPEYAKDKYKYISSLEDAASWVPESPIVSKPLITAATKAERGEIVKEKNWPDMWFMRKCRHAYKVLQAPRATNVGYYVGIREIKIYKKDKLARDDSFNYVQSLVDESTTLVNTFYQRDWRWTLTPQDQFLLGDKKVVEYASESFNGEAF
jgi:hypothetical protein